MTLTIVRRGRCRILLLCPGVERGGFPLLRIGRTAPHGAWRHPRAVVEVGWLHIRYAWDLYRRGGFA